MRSNSKWMPATIVFVVVSFTAVQLAPAAFGQNVVDTSKAEGHATESALQGTSPNAQFNARQAIAQLDTQGQTSAAASRKVLPAFPANAKSKNKSKGWIIFAATFGTGVAFAIMTHRGRLTTPAPSPSASIVALAPTVGQPE